MSTTTPNKMDCHSRPQIGHRGYGHNNQGGHPSHQQPRYKTYLELEAVCSRQQVELDALATELAKANAQKKKLHGLVKDVWCALTLDENLENIKKLIKASNIMSTNAAEEELSSAPPTANDQQVKSKAQSQVHEQQPRLQLQDRRDSWTASWKEARDERETATFSEPNTPPSSSRDPSPAPPPPSIDIAHHYPPNIFAFSQTKKSTPATSVDLSCRGVTESVRSSDDAVLGKEEIKNICNKDSSHEAAVPFLDRFDPHGITSSSSATKTGEGTAFDSESAATDDEDCNSFEMELAGISHAPHHERAAMRKAYKAREAARMKQMQEASADKRRAAELEGDLLKKTLLSENPQEAVPQRAADPEPVPVVPEPYEKFRNGDGWATQAEFMKKTGKVLSKPSKAPQARPAIPQSQGIMYPAASAPLPASSSSFKQRKPNNSDKSFSTAKNFTNKEPTHPKSPVSLKPTAAAPATYELKDVNRKSHVDTIKLPGTVAASKKDTELEVITLVPAPNIKYAEPLILDHFTLPAVAAATPIIIGRPAVETTGSEIEGRDMHAGDDSSDEEEIISTEDEEPKLSDRFGVVFRPSTLDAATAAAISGAMCSKDARRSVLVQNIPGDTTCHEFLSYIRGGSVVAVKMVPDFTRGGTQMAMVTFKTAKAARDCVDVSSARFATSPLFKKISLVLLPTASYPTAEILPEVPSKPLLFAQVPTRCIVVEDYPKHLLEDLCKHLCLKSDAMPCKLDALEEMWYAGNDLYISYTSIEEAKEAHRVIPFRPHDMDMPALRYSFAPDPCAEPVAGDMPKTASAGCQCFKNVLETVGLSSFTRCHKAAYREQLWKKFNNRPIKLATPTRPWAEPAQYATSAAVSQAVWGNVGYNASVGINDASSLLVGIDMNTPRGTAEDSVPWTAKNLVGLDKLF